MPTIHIGSRQALAQLHSDVYQEIAQLDDGRDLIKLEQRQVGKYNFLDCSLSGDSLRVSNGNSEERFLSYIAFIIADLILGRISKDFLYRIIRIDHPYLQKEEAWSLTDQALSSLQGEGYTDRRKRIQKKVENFLKENDQILLEGFVRFRLKEYFLELKEILEKVIDDFLVDREYQEFIKLLQYFVEIQEPKVPEVHVLFYNDQNFRLLDEEEKPLDQDYLRRVLGDLQDEDLKYDDLLLSALITLSPQRIILHHAEKPEIGKTIANVFKERVTYCRDCELCRDLKKD